MAVLFDNASGTGASGVAAVQFDFAIADDNTAIAIQGSLRSTASRTITSMTWSGEAVPYVQDDTGQLVAGLGVLVGPITTGTGTARVQISASARMAATAASYTGVDSEGASAKDTQTSSTTVTASVPSAPSDAVVIGGAGGVNTLAPKLSATLGTDRNYQESGVSSTHVGSLFFDRDGQDGVTALEAADSVSSEKILHIVELLPVGGPPPGNEGDGAVTADKSSTAGTGQREVNGSAAVTADKAAIDGAGEVVGVSEGTGAVLADKASVTGLGEREAAATGAVLADKATISGLGELVGAVAGTGAVTADQASIAGTGEREAVATGAVTADKSTIAGLGEVAEANIGNGAVVARASTIAGTGLRTDVQAVGAVTAGASFVAGEASGPRATPSRTYVVTAKNVNTRRKIEAFRDSTEVIAYDLRPWESGGEPITSVTWEIERGMARLSQETLSDGVASATLDFREQGRNAVAAHVVAGNRTLVLRMQAIARYRGFIV